MTATVFEVPRELPGAPEEFDELGTPSLSPPHPPRASPQQAIKASSTVQLFCRSMNISGHYFLRQQALQIGAARESSHMSARVDDQIGLRNMHLCMGAASDGG